MKLLRKLVVALLMLLLVAIGSPLKVSALPNNNGNEWPTKGSNDVTTTLPQPPAVANVVDLSLMFNYPTLNYKGVEKVDRPDELDAIEKLKGYVYRC